MKITISDTTIQAQASFSTVGDCAKLAISIWENTEDIWCSQTMSHGIRTITLYRHEMLFTVTYTAESPEEVRWLSGIMYTSGEDLTWLLIPRDSKTGNFTYVRKNFPV